MLAVAELAVGIPAPTPDRPRVEERARVRESERDLPDAPQASNGNRQRGGGERAVTELAKLVPSPAPDCPHLEQRAAVREAERDLSDARQTPDGDRQEGWRGRAVTELPIEVPPPALDSPRAHNLAGVRVARRKLDRQGANNVDRSVVRRDLRLDDRGPGPLSQRKGAGHAEGQDP